MYSVVSSVVITVVLIQFLEDSHAIDITRFTKEVPLCGNRSELQLAPDGFESSRIISLKPSEEYEYCSLGISAPATHAIHFQFLEDLSRMKHKFHTTMPTTCILQIYLDEEYMKPVWYGDLCTSEPLKSVDLLSSKVTIRWKSSYDRLQTKGRKIIVTAVGHGEFCGKPNQHTCMKIGFEPIFCVSTDITCDGHENCPHGSTTSDEGTFCEGLSIWHRRFMGAMNKIPSNIESTIRKAGYIENSTELPKMLNDIGRTLNNIKRLTMIETTTKASSETRAFGSLHDLLSQYDPWGYLCLGVVLCGSLLLMCCGIWECCVRRYKTDSINNITPPTTVLIVNNYDENGTQQQPPYLQHQPPNYDDLDLPPSYTALFPNKPPEERIIRARNINAPEIIPMDSINMNRLRNEESRGNVTD